MRKVTNSPLEDENGEITIEPLDESTRLFSAEIVARWANGESPRQIANETGRPVITIYRILKELRKAITKEIGIVHQPTNTSLEKVNDPLLPEQQAKQKIGRVAREPKAMGKYAHIPGSSEDFSIEKQKDIAKEDRQIIELHS